MVKGKPLVISITVIVLAVTALILIAGKIKNNNLLQPLPSPTPTGSISPDVSDMIQLDNPEPDQTIKSPVTLVGQARGYWYFEASFPARMYDANGKELGVVVVQAQDEWMTEDFVPFNTVFNFQKPTTTTGTLVLEKDNPSGLPENDAQLRVPVAFDLANWSTASACKATGCSGQICSDQDVITTCEYSPEYACYKNARCERQENGQCGWTPTEELVACLGSAFQAEP